MTAGTRVRLTEAAQADFSDIGDRDGVVLRVDLTPVVRWRGIFGETSLKAELLEVIA